MPTPTRNQRCWMLLGAIVAGLAASVWFVSRNQPAAPLVAASQNPPPPGDAPEVVETTAGKPSGRPLTILTDAPFAQEFGDAETSPERELELVQLAFNDYLQFVKAPYRRPFGFNAELVALLVGGNPYKIAPIPPKHPRINAEGQLTDRWGSSLHIHPLSSTAIEIRSAGPDKQLWTDDDLQSVTLSGRDVLDAMVTGDGDSQTIDDE